MKKANKNKVSDDKKPNYIILSKIIVAFFSVVCAGLAVFGLFGLTKVHLKQTKTEGRVIGITSYDLPNEITKKGYIYTFEYTADDGETRQFEVKYNKVVYMPLETVDVWYFADSREANGHYTTGWWTFGVFLPITVMLVLVNIFAIKSKKEQDDIPS